MGRLFEGLRFDYVFTFALAVSLGGVYLDGWAHNNVEVIDTFFTPWHALMYLGFGLVMAACVGAVLHSVAPVGGSRARLREVRRRRLDELVPAGYELSVIGVVIYLVAGVVDFARHQIFGFETNVEALFSPTHVALLLGAALFRTGPLRAAWLRQDPDLPRGGGAREAQAWKSYLPAILSAAFFLSSLAFFTQYVHPFGLTPAAAEFQPSPVAITARADAREAADFVLTSGVAGIAIQTVLLMSFVLMLVRRWSTRLPFGALTILIALPAILMVAMRYRYLSTGAVPLMLVAVIGGLGADLLYRALRPSSDAVIRFRLFALVAPAFLYVLYFDALFLYGGGTWWTPAVWVGLVAIAGAIGWMMSFLVLAPALPATPEARGESATP